VSNAGESRSADRVLRSHEEARESYNRLAAWYDLFGGTEWRFDLMALRLLDPRPGEAILEIGHGTGRALEWIRKRSGRGTRVVGADLSEGMHDVAMRRLAKRGYEDVQLIITDALELPFRGQTFDGVFMGFTLELFDTPELAKVLAEARRVMRRNGRLTLAALSLRRPQSGPVRIYRWAHRRFPRLVDCRPIPVAEVVTAAGFSINVLNQESMWGLPVDLLLATPTPSEATDGSTRGDDARHE